jgi:hypothetical protein
MSSKKPLEVGKLYQTKISISFYGCISNSFAWLKNLESKIIIMILENNCFDRFNKIITEDGQIGYIDSTFHHEDGGTVKKIN